MLRPCCADATNRTSSATSSTGGSSSKKLVKTGCDWTNVLELHYLFTRTHGYLPRLDVAPLKLVAKRSSNKSKSVFKPFRFFRFFGVFFFASDLILKEKGRQYSIEGKDGIRRDDETGLEGEREKGEGRRARDKGN
jgi:hypothetical protein